MTSAPLDLTRPHPSVTRAPPPGRFVPAPRDGGEDRRGTELQDGGQGVRVDRSWLGPLAPLLEDPAVTDVFVTGDSGTWVDRGGGARPEPRVHLSEAAVRDLAVRLVARGGRHVDESKPTICHFSAIKH